VIPVFVDIEGVSGGAVLLAQGTQQARSLEVLGFHVDMHHGGAVGGKATISTLVLAIRPPVHARLDRLFHVICEK
jgi:hypothetical protein